ncbi:DUF1700 domain-containing protein [Glutamicibacter sp.]|uniref:DUF1700 domain-containing protein n=1 Tax=Glutamicibacter sp. TaxID=1931995 RepID=UPI002B46D969|nr:DUF1700 domain-containing protein [Glutamicibacter sp.]HJX79506.1 DUF1700 domain-containing protein [Glutamicibacter sp.]
MFSTKPDVTAKRYLRQLSGYLADLPEAQRRVILQDISEHIEESIFSGRTESEAISALGEPKEVAKASRSELGIPEPRGTGPWPVGTSLIGAAVAMATFTAVIVSFFLRNAEGQHPDSTNTTERTLSSLLEFYGPGVAVLTLLPAVLVAALLFVPLRMRRWATLGCAIATTVLVFYNPMDAGLFYVPTAILIWLAATLPFAKVLQAGRRESVLLQIIGLCIVLLPVVVLFAGSVNDSFSVVMIPALIWAVACLALAIGVVLNRRIVYWIILIYGLLALVTAAFNSGILVAAIWLFGGIVLSFGIYGLLRLRPRAGITR